MKRILIAIAASAILGSAATTIQAQTITDISLQYVTSLTSNPIGLNDAGVLQISGWNQDVNAAAESNLLDSNGNPTGISASTVAPWGGVYQQQYAFSGAAAGDAALFDAGALSTNTSPVVLTLSGLNPADTYTLITYSMSNTQSQVEGSITGGAAYYLTNPSSSYATYTQGLATTPAARATGDYFEFTDITGVTSLTYSLTNQGGAFADMPGFQLIQTAPAVPEPATYGMMLLGMGLLVVAQRFTRRSGIHA